MLITFCMVVMNVVIILIIGSGDCQGCARLTNVHTVYICIWGRRSRELNALFGKIGWRFPDKKKKEESHACSEVKSIIESPQQRE